MRRKDEETVRQEERLKGVEETMAQFKEKVVALCGHSLSSGDRIGALEGRVEGMEDRVKELQVTFLGLCFGLVFDLRRSRNTLANVVSRVVVLTLWWLKTITKTRCRTRLMLGFRLGPCALDVPTNLPPASLFHHQRMLIRFPST